ncbi:hypothetical protein D3C84_786670 [compost metagenome]
MQERIRRRGEKGTFIVFNAAIVHKRYMNGFQKSGFIARKFDEPSEHRLQLGQRRLTVQRFEQLLDIVLEPVEMIVDQLETQIALLRIPAVQRSLSDPGRLRDLMHADGINTELREQIARRI